MGKNYVEDKDMERKDEMKDNYEKEPTGYNDSEDPSMKDMEQQFPGDEIVEDLREMSRQQGQKEDGDPDFISGENVQQEQDKPRYGDRISETAEKKDEDASSEWKNEKNYQNSN